LRLVATDAAGNVTTSTSVTGVHVDNTPPTVTITAPADGSYLNAGSSDPATVTASSASSDLTGVEFFACSDTSSHCDTRTRQPLGVDYSAPYAKPWTLPADGDRALAAVATDHAGNSSNTATVNVTVDRTV